MAKIRKLHGMDKVLVRLGQEIKKIEDRSVKGLIRGGIIIRRGTEQAAPKTPIDTGNLRASWFMVTSKGSVAQGKTAAFKGGKAGELAGQHSQLTGEYATISAAKGQPNIIMGYTANYAMVVHEKIGASFQRPGAGAKWLESSIKRNSKQILKVIQKEVRIA
jgi:hypothetical protein